MNKSRFAGFGIAALVALASGCSSMGVEPWERDILARDDMQLTTDPVEAAIRRVLVKILNEEK